MRQLIQSGLWLAGGMLAGRLAGFVREATLAATFGAGAAADVAVLMLTVPDFLVNVLVGGALSAVLIPAFRRHGGLRGAALFAQASLLTGGAFAALAIGCALATPALVGLFAPGFDASQAALAARALPLAMGALPLTTLAGVTTAWLQARDRFAMPAFGTLIYNAVLIAGLIALVRPGGGDLALLGAAVLAAGLARWGSQRLLGPRPLLDPRLLRLPLVDGAMARRYAEALGASGLLLLMPIAARALASYHDPGSLAIVNYATKLVELPLGVCVSVFAVVLFPKLAEAFGRPGGGGEAAALVRRGAGLVLVAAGGLGLALGWYAPDLAAAAFGLGRMPAPALAAVGLLTAIGMASLPAQGLSQLLVAAANARGDTRTPLLVAIGALAAFGVLAGPASTAYGLPGIMGALTVITYGAAAAQALALRRSGAVPGLFGALARAGLGAGAAMAAAFVPLAWLGERLPLPPLARAAWAGLVAALLVGCGLLTLRTAASRL